MRMSVGKSIVVNLLILLDYGKKFKYGKILHYNVILCYLEEREVDSKI